jgi:hypothetical protein
MPDFRPIHLKKGVLCAIAEAASGTPQDPGTTVGIEFRAMSFKPDAAVLESGEYTPSLDPGDPAIGSVKGKLDFEVLLKGALAGAGILPEWAALPGCCNWQLTITAAAVPVAPEACLAGGSTTTAKLGASASATDQIYRGMPITFTGAVAGTTIITDYNGATKTATLADTMSGAIIGTTSWQIPPNVTMQPISPTTPVTDTLDFYEDGLKYRFFGCAGEMVSNWVSANQPVLKFSMTAYGFTEADVALINPTLEKTIRAPVWKGGVMTFDRLPAALKTWTFETKNTITLADNPNGPEGYDVPDITGRLAGGTLDPKKTLVATRDTIGMMRTGVTGLLHGRCGSAVGNRLAKTVARAQITSYAQGRQWRRRDQPARLSRARPGLRGADHDLLGRSG